MKILRAPALHFAVAGALFFWASKAFEALPPSAASAVHAAQREILIDAARIGGLTRDYHLANHSTPTEAETRSLVVNLVNDEILFREGVARGFEQGDRSIAGRLEQKMRYLGEDHGEDSATLYRRALAMGLHASDPVVRRILIEKVRLVVGRAAPKPTDDELTEWYTAHGSEYQQPERLSLTHVFFDRGRRGGEAAHAAAEAAAAQAQGRGADVAGSLGGDPFVMGTVLSAQGRGDLTKFFGPAFANEVLSMPTGVWGGPVESAYGWHIVRVEQRIEPRVPDLSEVRSRVFESFESSRRAQRVAEFLEKVRPSYTIRIDEDAVRGGVHG
jgi:hypothetical protein